MDEFSLIVYFVRNPKTNLVKIGKAKDFKERYRTLCREEGCQLDVLLIVYAEDTERQLHHYFSETKAFKNEWFTYDDRLKELISLSERAGHLVYPEGAPYRDLPVDMRQQVKLQAKNIAHLSSKIFNLSLQLNQVRQKRDEYKKLSDSAGYYKMLVDKARIEEKAKDSRLHARGMFFAVMCIVLMLSPLIIWGDNIPMWGSRLSLLFEALSALFAGVGFYKTKEQGRGKSMKRFSLVMSAVLFSVSAVLVFVILALYLFGDLP